MSFFIRKGIKYILNNLVFSNYNPIRQIHTPYDDNKRLPDNFKTGFAYSSQFLFSQSLGEGAYSSVYKVKRLSDTQEYALKQVKLLNLSEKEKQNALNEVRILASIKHPSIIAYKEAFIEEATNSLWY